MPRPNTGITNGIRKIMCGAIFWMYPESTQDERVTAGCVVR